MISKPMKLILADDHALFRDSLKGLLTAHGIEVLAEASNGRQAVELARRLQPDIVLMDLDMPDMDGLAATRTIADEMPGVKVVILTGSPDDHDLFEAIKAGAEGYVQKELESRPFLDLLDGVLRGEPALTPQLARKLLAEFAAKKQAPAKQQGTAKYEDPDALTNRELEVLETMVGGTTTTRALAKKLGLSENTVKFHVRNILDKLRLHNRAEAVGYALRHHLVDPDSASDDDTQD